MLEMFESLNVCVHCYSCLWICVSFEVDFLLHVVYKYITSTAICKFVEFSSDCSGVDSFVSTFVYVSMFEHRVLVVDFIVMFVYKYITCDNF